MSLNDIKLSPFLVKKLYEKTLVLSSFAETEITIEIPILKGENGISNPEKTSITSNAQIKHLGNNGKNILILVNESEHAFLGDDELSFLMNILNACHITMADAALVNIYTDKTIGYKNLMEVFSPSTILFLGTEPQALEFPIQIPVYQVQQYNNQQYLCAPSLHKLSTDKEEKKQLWNALKKIFSIS